MKLIPIHKEHIPYEVQYRLGNNTYKLVFQYNYFGDYFTVDLYRNADPLILGEKLLIGKPLFSTYTANDRLPKTVIVPADLSMTATRTGWDEMSESVYLYMPEDLFDEVD